MSLANHPKLVKARTYAIAAHTAVGQKRKYTGEDYHHHPIAVANILMDHTDDLDIISAAYLHDIVEDTNITDDQLCDVFGPKIGMYVHWCTSDKSYSPSFKDMTREKRKACDRIKYAEGPYESQLIKVADSIHNMTSIIEHDPTFAKTYIEEKRMLLEIMDKTRDTDLYKIAIDIIETYYDTKR